MKFNRNRGIGVRATILLIVAAIVLGLGMSAMATNSTPGSISATSELAGAQSTAPAETNGEDASLSAEPREAVAAPGNTTQEEAQEETPEEAKEEEKEEATEGGGRFTVIFQYPEIKTTNADGSETLNELSGTTIVEYNDVEEGASVEPPQEFAVPEGYTHAGWSSDAYQNVHADATIEAILWQTSQGTAEVMPRAPYPNEPGVVVKFFDYNNPKVEFTDFANWDFYTGAYNFTLNIEINPLFSSNAAESAGQQVVLTPPQGMKFVKPSGTLAEGIKSIGFNNGKVTITLSDAYLADDTKVGSITTSLHLMAYFRLDFATTRAHAVRTYRSCYLPSGTWAGGRPTFETTVQYLRGNVAMPGVEDQNIVLTPMPYTDPTDSAFALFGIRAINFAASNVGYPTSLPEKKIIISQFATLYAGSIKDESLFNGRFSFFEKKNVNTESEKIFYEPVWNVEAKLYLPDMIIATEEWKSCVKTDPGTGERYLLIGGKDGMPLRCIIDSEETATMAGVGKANDGYDTVYNCLRLDPTKNRMDYNGQSFIEKLVVNYTTVNAAGENVSYEQIINNAMEFDFAKVQHCDWIQFNTDPEYYGRNYGLTESFYPTIGFVLPGEEIFEDKARYILFETPNVSLDDVLTHTNETHKGGTLTFENKGGYYLDAIHYNTAKTGALSVQYYTSGSPGTPKVAVPSADASWTTSWKYNHTTYATTAPQESAQVVRFGAQTPGDYVTRVVFTFDEGHREFFRVNDEHKLLEQQENYWSYFGFDMHGQSGLAPNKSGDENFYHTALDAVLKSATGCGLAGEDVSRSLPTIKDGAHTYNVPVKIRLTKGDSLIANVVGESKLLAGAGINYETGWGGRGSIFVYMGYDARDENNKYINDPTVKTPYSNFCMKIGTPSPAGENMVDGQDASLLMLQRLRGEIYLAPALHYQNAYFLYKTNQKTEWQKLVVGDNGEPKNMSATGGTAKTVLLELLPDEYVTAMEFHADSFRVARQIYGGLSSNNRVLWSTINEISPSYIEFNTCYWRTFPGGIPIREGRASINEKVGQTYGVYTEMTADKMKPDEAASGRGSYLHVPNGFGLFSTSDPGSPVLSLDSKYKNVYQGTVIQENVEAQAYESGDRMYVQDFKVWLELNPNFVYVGNDAGIKVTSKVAPDGAGGTKTYLCIAENEKIILEKRGYPSYTLKFMPLVAVGSNVAPITRVWLDYSKSTAEKETLRAEWPYISVGDNIADYRYRDKTAPVLNSEFTTAESQILIKGTSFPTLTVSKSNAVSVTLMPRAGIEHGAGGFVNIRPKQTDDLGLLVSIDSGTSTNTSNLLHLKIPVNGNEQINTATAEFPLRLTGKFEVQYNGATDGNFSVTYCIGSAKFTQDEMEANNRYAEVDALDIAVPKLEKDSLILRFPLKALASTATWKKEAQAMIGGTYRYVVGAAGAQQELETTLATWLLEDIDNNVISGTVFQDKNHNHVTEDTDGLLPDVMVELYRAEGGAATGDALKSAATDSKGAYKFDKLRDGDYIVKVAQPTPYTDDSGGYQFAAKGSSNTANTSKVNANGSTDVISVEDAKTVKNVHAGVQYGGVIRLTFQHLDASGKVVGTSGKTQIRFNTQNYLVKDGVLQLPFALPENFSLVADTDPNISITTDDWKTTLYERTLYVTYTGEVRTVHFQYQDTDGNEVEVNPAEKMADQEVWLGYDAEIPLTIANATKRGYTYLGYRLDGDPTLLQDNPLKLTAVTENRVVTFVYEYTPTAPFAFNKVARDKTPLPEVEFTLYPCKEKDVPGHVHSLMATSGSCWDLANGRVATSDSSGHVDFGELPLEDYMLVETKTVSGYALPSGQWLVQILAADELKITARYEGTNLPPAFKLEGGVYTVANYLISDLPRAGTQGIIGTTLVGVLTLGMVMLAYMVWLNSQRTAKHVADVIGRLENPKGDAKLGEGEQHKKKDGQKRKGVKE